MAGAGAPLLPSVTGLSSLRLILSQTAEAMRAPECPWGAQQTPLPGHGY